MADIYILPEDDSVGGLYRRMYLLVSKNQRTWQTVGATLGLAGGMLSMFTGLLLWMLNRFYAAAGEYSSVHVLEMLFFVLTVPLMVSGAHCLDILEQRSTIDTMPAKSHPTQVGHWLPLRPRCPHNN